VIPARALAVAAAAALWIALWYFVGAIVYWLMGGRHAD
jgi:hypothetical protein